MPGRASGRGVDRRRVHRRSQALHPGQPDHAYPQARRACRRHTRRPGRHGRRVGDRLLRSAPRRRAARPLVAHSPTDSSRSGTSCAPSCMVAAGAWPALPTRSAARTRFFSTRSPQVLQLIDICLTSTPVFEGRSVPLGEHRPRLARAQTLGGCRCLLSSLSMGDFCRFRLYPRGFCRGWVWAGTAAASQEAGRRLSAPCTYMHRGI